MATPSTAAQSWSAHASSYASKVVQVTLAGSAHLLSLVNELRPLDPSSIILDSGCGSGALTSLLHKACPQAHITAADIAPGMLAVLQKQHDFPADRVRTLLLDASNDHVEQGLNENSFSHAVSSFMMQFLTPAEVAQPRCVQEMYRVLQPGGVIGLAIWSVVETGEPWDRACKKLDPTGYVSNHGVFGSAWRSTDDMEGALEKAGFVDVRSGEKELELVFESAEDFAETFLNSGNPAFIKLMSTWKGRKEDVRNELIRVTRDEFQNGRIRMVAACTVGRKPSSQASE